MPEPSVEWRYIFDSPPECSGSGGTLSASALFEVAWADREAFVNEALGITSGSTGWPTPQIPWDCPFQPNTGLLASSFRFVPHSVKSTVASGDNTVSGHFDKAHVQIGFERPKYDYTVATPQNQIDVANPILFCEQTIETKAESIVIPAWELEFVGAPSTEVPIQPFFTFIDTAEYVLNFPFVPYIPWNYLIPFHEKTNDRVLFGRDPETVRFTGASLRNETLSNGTNRTSCVLRFAYKANGWNNARAANGGVYEIRRKGTGDKIFGTANLAAIWS